MGMIEALFLTTLITEVVKIGVGRLRPDFLNRCFGDDYLSVVNKMNDTRLYTRNDCTVHSGILDGSKSFFSGHTSSMFATAPFVTVYIMKLMDHIDVEMFSIFKEDLLMGALTIMSILPILFSLYVGMTRITDNKHHFSDIIGGAVAGVMTSYLYLYDVSGLKFYKDKDVLESINEHLYYQPSTYE